jgi:DNA-binding NarL/FixJ family response regulator
MNLMTKAETAAAAAAPLSLIDSFLGSISVSGALLDSNGRILEVSEGWKQFARSGKLLLQNYGIGEDYLKHAVFPDTSAVATLRGLKGILSGDIDVFSTIYRCDTPEAPKWFLLVGLAVDNDSRAAAAVLHIDISSFLQNRTSISAAIVGVGAAALDPAIETVTRAVRHAIVRSMQNSTIQNRDTSQAPKQKLVRSLSPHQFKLLAALAQGATNSDIARAHKISVGTAKNQTAALLKKLGVANRTQAAILAVTSGLIHEAG